MGCDIHLVVEKQVDGKWIAFNTMNFSYSINGKLHVPAARERNYKRFAAIAGVRGDGPKPKGLPEDISDTTKHLVDHWGPDGHSHTWLSLQEAVNIFEATEKEETYWLDTGHPAGFYFYVYEDGDPGEYRLIIWFDN